MRDLSHSHTLSGHTIVQANGSGGTFAPPRLEPVRHRPCGFSAPAHDAGRIGAGLRMDLSASLLSPVNLAAASSRLVRSAPLSRDVLSVQTVQPVLAPADQTRPRARRVVATGGAYSPATRSLSSALSAIGSNVCDGRLGRVSGSLGRDNSRPSLPRGRTWAQRGSNV